MPHTGESSPAEPRGPRGLGAEPLVSLGHAEGHPGGVRRSVGVGWRELILPLSAGKAVSGCSVGSPALPLLKQVRRARGREADGETGGRDVRGEAGGAGTAAWLRQVASGEV